jgi:hypothetical protein
MRHAAEPGFAGDESKALAAVGTSAQRALNVRMRGHFDRAPG